jgi:hypothetical protein
VGVAIDEARQKRDVRPRREGHKRTRIAHQLLQALRVEIPGAQSLDHRTERFGYNVRRDEHRATVGLTRELAEHPPEGVGNVGDRQEVNLLG